MKTKTHNLYDQLVTEFEIQPEEVATLANFIEELNKISETPGRISPASFSEITRQKKFFLVSKLGKIIEERLRLESYLAEPSPAGNEPYPISRLAHIPPDYCTGNYFGKLQMMHERHIIRVQRFFELQQTQTTI